MEHEAKLDRNEMGLIRWIWAQFTMKERNIVEAGFNRWDAFLSLIVKSLKAPISMLANPIQSNPKQIYKVPVSTLQP